jgi:hypothetical protein
MPQVGGTVATFVLGYMNLRVLLLGGVIRNIYLASGVELWRMYCTARALWNWLYILLLDSRNKFWRAVEICFIDS